MNKIINASILRLLSVVIIVGLSYFFQQEYKAWPDPKIKSEVAKLAGTLIDLKDNNYEVKVVLTAPNQVLGIPVKIETKPDENGNFGLEVPIVTDFTFCYLYIEDIENSSLQIPLVAGKETKLKITYNKDGKIETYMENSFPLLLNYYAPPRCRLGMTAFNWQKKSYYPIIIKMLYLCPCQVKWKRTLLGSNLSEIAWLTGIVKGDAPL